MEKENTIKNMNSNPEVLNDFLMYLKTVKNKSDNTINGYNIDLRLFLKYMKKTKKSLPQEVERIPIKDITSAFISKLTLSDLYGFTTYISVKRKNGSNAQARKVASIKSFYNYLYNKVKVIKDNVALELETPKIGKRNPIYLTLEQSENLLDYTEEKDNRNKERNIAIITVLLNCGVRVSELVGININDIMDDTIRIIGKGDKERTAYINEATQESLNNYLKVRMEIDAKDKDALFLSERRKRISVQMVENIVKCYCKDIGLSDKITPHKLRHSFSTIMYKNGNVDIRSLQQILGHESIATTQIYTHVDDNSLRKAVNSNPLGNRKH